MSIRSKNQAVQDIKKDSEKDHRAFLAFQEKLNPIMGKLVRKQLREQSSISHYHTPTPANSQLVAHCFFCKGEVKYNNYDKFYAKK